MPLFLLTSIDSLIASFGLGLAGTRSYRRRDVCFAFFAADVIATVVGLLLRDSAAGRVLQAAAPLILMWYLVAVFAGTVAAFIWRSRSMPPLLIVAAVLGIDNLVSACSGTGSESVFTLLLPGIASAAAALIGITGGQAFAARLPYSGRIVLSALLVALPVILPG